MESTSKLNLTHRLYEKEPRNGQRSLIAIVQKELPNFDKLRLITYFISENSLSHPRRQRAPRIKFPPIKSASGNSPFIFLGPEIISLAGCSQKGGAATGKVARVLFTF